MEKYFQMLSVCLFVMLCSEMSARAENDWYYPLEIQAGLSGTFGEFRGNRLHTGIDFRTNMQTGYKVYAVDSGKIVRLSVKKSGFGNAVYIQHPNGLMSVYAHLDRFVEEGLGLRSLVAQARKKRRTRYPGNIFLEKSVKKGQLIAYSGESGSGLPHLHWEVRQGGDAPIDPFEHGFRYQDDTPPTIEAVLIEPLGPKSTLEGQHGLREYPMEKENGMYTIRHVPRVCGKVRFTVSVYDQVGAQNKCGVARISLRIDGKDFFDNQFDRVTYDSNHRGGLVYDYNFTRLGNPVQYYYRLYTISAQHFPYRGVFAEHGGVWETSGLEEGLHTLNLDVRDAMGNLSSARMQLSVEKEHSPRPPQPAGAQEQRAHFELREFPGFLEFVFAPAEALQSAPGVTISHKHRVIKRIEMEPGGENSFAAVYALQEADAGILTIELTAVTQRGQALRESRKFPVQAISAKRGGTVTYGQEAEMSFPAGALYEDIFANIWPATAYHVTKGLPVIGDVYDFRPAGEPLEKRGSISIQYPESSKNIQELGIYWWDRLKQRWYYMDDKRQENRHSLTATIIYPSYYGILRDTIRPTISDLKPEAGSVTKALGFTLSAVIRDTGKGVDTDTLMMLLDDKPLAAEYDPDRHTLSYFLTQRLASGKHTLRIEASDKAGHPAKSQSSRFTVH
ncbi:hypothetical protein CSB45_00605 [candidate division KSB3 bacterium]|uniref:M23ase beta-sheet core domain-containing protein n=1 Tax=candidate division KSB3 bacterium TaxID=2044937 RepID=A0A2G6EEB7_9BACT|nr:MAG: hypothetical protein CSB45_00605 [candidate division KSB3 bacterium]PIE31071.1 MAG: hypothetical protein CSA57_00395 [candidate division KSB3 bacterium]